MKPSIIRGFVLSLLFWFSLQPVVDPDTGWHLATGRFITETKTIPSTDPFSFSLPDHPYIAHSWGMDVIMSAVDKLTGPIGLAVLFALLTTAFFALSFSTLRQSASPPPNPWWLLAVAYPAIEIIGTRPQVVTVVGLAWLLKLLALPPSGKRLWQLPLLFFVWANLHGGVLLGLAVFGIWLALSFITKTAKVSDLALLTKGFFLSLLATLANPYTYRLYTFAFGMVTNSISMIYNSDWVPLFSPRLGEESFLLRLIIVFASLIAILEPKKPIVYRIMAGLFLALSFKSLRYLIAMLPVIILLVLPTMEKIATGTGKTKGLVIALSLLILGLNFTVLFDKTKVLCSRHSECYAGQAEMPYGSVRFMKENRLSGRILNYYTWGGYLSWQLPYSRVFIDGRMDNFFINQTSFMTEFVAMAEAENGWYERLMKYQPNLALIPASWHAQLAELTRHGWAVIYQDNISLLLKKS